MDGRDTRWFKGALDQLYADAGKPFETDLISQAAKKGVTLDDSTLNDWLSGKAVPRDAERFAALVQLLREHAIRRQGPNYRQRNVEFEVLRAAAARERQRRKRGNGQVGGREDATGLGQLLEEITDPFALEVHRPIDVGLSPGADALDPLPPYVYRTHDGELRGVAQRAVEGVSGIAVLIGTSASGKTRACWEALQTLPAGWRLWHPADATAAAKQLGEVTSRTVVWLDDTHDRFLYTPASA